MLEILLALLPETLAEVFRNKTLKSNHIDNEPIVLQASCYLKSKKSSQRGAIALTESYLYFFKGNKLEEMYRFNNSEISKFKKGFLAGFTFIENSSNHKFTCGVEQPSQWIKSLRKWSRSSQSSQLLTRSALQS